MDFWHVSTSHEIENAATRKTDPENIVVAVGILIICVIVSEILLLPVSWLPSWISITHRRSTKPEVAPLERLSPKTGVAVGILSLCALELELCLGPFHPPPVAGKRRKKTVAGRRVK